MPVFAILSKIKHGKGSDLTVSRRDLCEAKPHTCMQEVTAMNTKQYPHPKELMLSAVYDALDALGLSIKSANRERGVVVLSPVAGRIRIAVNAGGGATEVAVIPEDSSAHELCCVIADEISAVINSCEQEENV